MALLSTSHLRATVYNCDDGLGPTYGTVMRELARVLKEKLELDDAQLDLDQLWAVQNETLAALLTNYLGVDPPLATAIQGACRRFQCGELPVQI